jgi:hypothetical protein
MSAATLTWIEIAAEETRHARLSVAVVLDSLVVPLWMHRLLQELEGSPHAELSAVFRLGRSDFRTCGGEAALLRLWRLQDRRWFHKRSPWPEAFEPTVFSPADPATSVADCPTRNRLEEAFSNHCTTRLFDLVLNLSTTADAHQIHAITCCPVWSFAGDEQLIERLVGRLGSEECVICDSPAPFPPATDGNTVTAGCWAMDRVSLFRNHSLVCWRRAELLNRQLAELQLRVERCGPGSPAEEDTRASAAVGNASSPTVAALLPRLAARLVREQIAKRLRREQWFIAYRPAGKEPQPWNLLLPPAGHFYADPFAIERAGRTYIFFEDYSYAAGKAVIAFVQLDEAGRCSQPEVALEEPFHLSYPSFFEWQGALYLLPETKSQRRVQLYRAVDFPRRWELDQVLLSDVSAVDSTLLRHEGKLWLFTSGLNTCDPWFDGDSELFLFWSEQLAGPWRPHALNPVVSDVRSSRCAGQLFFRDGALIRPAQDCSRVYGYAVHLNRIDQLSPTGYRETTIATILPDWLPGNIGTHTFNRTRSYEVLDGRTLIRRFSRQSHQSRRCAVPYRGAPMQRAGEK